MKPHLPISAAILAFIAVSAPAAAESPEVPPDPPRWITEFFRAVPQEPPDDIFSHAGQKYMQMLPAVGREDIHAAQRDWRMRARTCEPSPDSREPIEAIVELARDTRIVIVNEAHDRPRHRDFIRQVAIALEPLGYTRFAAETFRDFVVESPERRFPRVIDGYYSNEPVFGRLLREVLSLDYRLEVYEYRGAASDLDMDSYWARADRREEAQAENLARIIASMGSEERILIHVGYSHAAEVPIPSFDDRELAWMAARLREKTGIDPLTIDQTDCASASQTTALTAAAERHVPGQFDLVVGHPPLTFERNRPTWRMRDRSAVRVSVKMRSDSQRVLIEVRPEGEPSYTVPVDRLMLWPGEDLPLLLEEGRYELTAWFEATGASESALLMVN